MGVWREIFPKVDETYSDYNEYDGDYDADYYDTDPSQERRNYKRNGRRMKIAGGIAAVVAVGAGLIVWAGSDNKPRNSVAAEQTPSAATDSGSTESASPSASASESESATPSPTESEEASPSPSATSASPSPTKTHVVIPATPTPETTTSAPVDETYGACHINPNATSVDYRHRESICDKPVTAFTDSYGTTPAFEVNGPVMFNCLDAERGYVEASISNAVGWVALPDLANDICN